MARSKLRRAVYALACVTPLLAACNAILGIDDYDRAECSGGGACLGDGGNRTDGDTEGGRDAGRDVQFIDATGTAPVSWIQFRMPNYAQTGVPDASVPNYVPQAAADGGGIVDDVSRRVWRPVGDSPDERASKTLADATKFCEGVPGNVKWRVPTRIELISLLDFPAGTTVAPTSNAAFNMERETYWTTSAYRERAAAGTAVVVTTRNWVVSFRADTDPVNTLETVGDTPGTARVICIQGL